jgi:hypothetical protein
MIVHRKSQQAKVKRVNITIDKSNEIQQVTLQKYLGVWIDENASLDQHIHELNKKITVVVNILSQLKWTLPHDILKKIYFAHIHSHLYYVPSIYGVSKKENIENLQIQQSRALKHVFKLNHLTPTIDVFEKYAKNILPIKGITYHATVNLIHKINKSSISTNIILPNLSNSARRDNVYLTNNCSSDFSKRDLTYHGVRCYNTLPNNVKKITNPHTFKERTKKFLLSRLSHLLNPTKFSLLELT